MWHAKRDTEVLSFWDLEEPMRSVDLFVHNPIEVTEHQPSRHGWKDQWRDQLVRGLAVTPAQRVSWLEEALALAHHMRALRAPDQAHRPPEPAGPKGQGQ